MLDLVFLVLMATAFSNAIFGKMNETLIAFATVVGVIAGVLGFVSAFLNHTAGSSILVLFNLIVIILAVCTRFIAKHFVKLYEDKQQAAAERLRLELENRSRRQGDIKVTAFTDENFDDPDLRFNGEFKEFKD